MIQLEVGLRVEWGQLLLVGADRLSIGVGVQLLGIVWLVGRLASTFS